MDERHGKEAMVGSTTAKGWGLKKKKKSGHGRVILGWGFGGMGVSFLLRESNL